MKRAVVFGQNGALACAVAKAFVAADWTVSQVGRDERTPTDPHDAFVFPQGMFIRRPFTWMSDEDLEDMINVGLLTVMKRLRDCAAIPGDGRVDYCLIGSTSSYAGFTKTAAYCAAKFALRGLVQSLNEEYKNTDRRFWLFSMGSMDTPMSRQLTEQNRTTFLSPDDVAERIVSTITSPSNLFEPEVLIRRRVVK